MSKIFCDGRFYAMFSIIFSSILLSSNGIHDNLSLFFVSFMFCIVFCLIFDFISFEVSYFKR